MKPCIRISSSIFVTMAKPSSLFFLLPQSNLPIMFNQQHSSSLSLLLLHQTHIQRPIICARRNTKGSVWFPQRYRKLMVNALYYFLASKLNAFPEPLDFLIRESWGGIGGGGGGGFGFGKGFGFDSWRKRCKRLGFLEFIVVLGGLLGLWLLVFGNNNVVDTRFFLGVLSLTVCVAWLNVWKGGLRDWGLVWFCCCAVCVGLRLKREEELKKRRCVIGKGLLLQIIGISSRGRKRRYVK